MRSENINGRTTGDSFGKITFHSPKGISSGDMSRIDLVSKNLLANVFRNCRKRNNSEKSLSQNH